MNKIKFSYIVVASFLSFALLTFVYYQKTREMAIENAQEKINDMLLNYRAVRTYVSEAQKEEIYKLQYKGILNQDFFSPPLLSSTYSASHVNAYYNKFQKKLHQNPITIRFASDNPRNMKNKANKKESQILKKFNNKEIQEYTEIIDTNGKPILYYVLPTKPTTEKCMRCHSDPKLAPKGLIEIYGDKNGFHEKIGNIRAILSTTYPLEKDFNKAYKNFLIVTFITFGIFVFLLFLIYFFTRKINEANITLDKKVIQRTKELEGEKQHIKAILDVNPNIIMVMNQSLIISANKQFLEFFDCRSIEDFIKRYKTIGDFIVTIDGKRLSENSKIEGIFWCEFFANQKEITHTITIEFNDKIYYFLANIIHFDNQGDILVTLNNITEQKRKDKLLFEQSKLAAMGEMIGNIAHQWRQPLSVISTSSTGMQLQKEYNMLDDKKFQEYCEIINNNVQYLSKTIDDFRDFIKADKVKTNFIFQECVDSFLKLVDGSIKSSNITVVLNIDSSIVFLGYQNEMVQCFMNLFNNAKYVLDTKPEEERYIFITITQKENQIIVSFKDSGGGIEPEIQSKIFEPYFTTKHKSQGTGLGLHMIYSIIVESMGGTIEIENKEYQYESKKLQGAEFIIKFPI